MCNNTTFEGLPDISKEIVKVIKHYDESLNEHYKAYDLKHSDRFLDAWFEVQKDIGIRLYYGSLQDASKAKISSVA